MNRHYWKKPGGWIILVPDLRSDQTSLVRSSYHDQGLVWDQEARSSNLRTPTTFFELLPKPPQPAMPARPLHPFGRLRTGFMAWDLAAAKALRVRV